MSIDNIISSLLIPHILAAMVLFKIATLEVRPDKTNTMREDFRLLWAWLVPHWRAWVASPLYWAACALVSAFFLAGLLKGVL